MLIKFMVVLIVVLFSTLSVDANDFNRGDRLKKLLSNSENGGFRERLKNNKQSSGSQNKNIIDLDISSLNHDGVERWYGLYIPQKASKNSSAVVVLHGGTGSMHNVFRSSAVAYHNWIDIADKTGTVLIVPNGTNNSNGDTKGDHQNWNDFRNERSDSIPPADDVGFITHLIDYLSEKNIMDRSKVFVTGTSNGGTMTYRLLVEKPEYFNAGAAFAANFPVDNFSRLPKPSKPTPLFIMNGTDDPLMKYDGGKIKGRDGNGVTSMAETISWWVKNNNASLQNHTTTNLVDYNLNDQCHLKLDMYPVSSSNNSSPVYAYTVLGGGHSVPSLKQASTQKSFMKRLVGEQCNSAEEVKMAWDFFQNHSN